MAPRDPLRHVVVAATEEQEHSSINNNNNNNTATESSFLIDDDDDDNNNNDSNIRSSFSIHDDDNNNIIDSSPPTMKQMDPHEPVRRPSVFRRESFIVQFATSNGPPQIVLLVILVALGFGSTIGIVPNIMTDRFATLNHGLSPTDSCSNYHTMDDKPLACICANEDAQNAAAMASLISNCLTFFSSSLVGSISDEYGRRGILVAGVLLSTVSHSFLLWIQLFPTMSPYWYYAASSTTGVISWMAVSLSALADVLPPQWRAPGVGLLMAGFLMGLSIAPTLSILLSHFQVTILSCTTITIAFICTAFFFPETLPPNVAQEARQRRKNEEKQFHSKNFQLMIWKLIRPFREMSIINRNNFFRLLSTLAFFSGMVSAGDQVLLIYYVESKLNFTSTDVAVMFLILGGLGIFAQAVVLKPLNDCIGERLVVTLCFIFGATNNVLYGIASNKQTLFVGVAIAAFTSMAFPSISAMKANNVRDSEQGRIQGALYSLQALAGGVGPVLLRFVGHYTQGGMFGTGSMFIFAGFLYLIAVFVALALPKDKANTKKTNNNNNNNNSIAKDAQTIQELMGSSFSKSEEEDLSTLYGSV